MEYFDPICNIIMAILGSFGISLFLFVIIRDNFCSKNDKNNNNKGTDSGRGH
jgi:hypothetical protein